MAKVAVVQAGSVGFDAPATVEKLVRLLGEVAAEGAVLAVFPEAFIGGYPKGLTFGAPVGRRTEAGRDEYLRYAKGAVRLDGPEVAAIAAGSARTGVFVITGVIERRGATLYCTAVHIDPAAGLVGWHRKLMPTAAERLIWGFGDGSTLPVVATPAGRAGAVICWESYMPMLRQAMYAQGVELYCAPTVDDREAWQATMRHVALEGRCFVLSACQAMRRSDYPADYATALDPDAEGWLIRGGSVIVDPLGTVLAGPVYGAETILYADVDLAQRTRGLMDLDVAGHYARPDVFRLHVDTRQKAAVQFDDGDDA